jgi:hypothetical protein
MKDSLNTLINLFKKSKKSQLIVVESTIKKFNINAILEKALTWN